jgi:hypothetical protein
VSDFNKSEQRETRMGLGISDAITKGQQQRVDNVLGLVLKLNIREQVTHAISKGERFVDVNINHREYTDSSFDLMIEMLSEEGLICSVEPPVKGCCPRMQNSHVEPVPVCKHGKDWNFQRSGSPYPECCAPYYKQINKPGTAYKSELVVIQPVGWRCSICRSEPPKQGSDGEISIEINA